MSQAGRRVAELHTALAGNRELPEFTPEPTRREDIQRWIDDILVRAERTFDTLKQRRDTLREADRPLADQLLARQSALPDRLKALLPREIDGFNIRHHGDFHLGQMLIVKDDIFIIDFDGAAGTQPHRAPAQGAGCARRRGLDSFDRLFGNRCS